MNTIPDPSPELPSTEGRLVYAIGDIHGRVDLLTSLVRAILVDALALRPNGRPLLVMLGDYIDRGSDSAAVIELALQLQADEAVEVKAVRGNHEDALLSFLDDPSIGPTWIQFGGGATLASYGVAAPAQGADDEAWLEASQALARELPSAHRHFLNALPHAVVVGDYVFVHAGLRPDVPLHEQSINDLLWIRDAFFDAQGSFEKVVVHGHTPSQEPQVFSHRIGIDTGAYASGVLTALRLDGHGQALIQVSAGQKPPQTTL